MKKTLLQIDAVYYGCLMASMHRQSTFAYALWHLAEELREENYPATTPEQFNSLRNRSNCIATCKEYGIKL